jgi:hypothetical protein
MRTTAAAFKKQEGEAENPEMVEEKEDQQS